MYTAAKQNQRERGHVTLDVKVFGIEGYRGGNGKGRKTWSRRVPSFPGFEKNTMAPQPFFLHIPDYVSD